LSNLFKFIQTCSTEFTVQAKFTVHSVGLSVNSAGLSAKSAGWGFHCSNFESNGFRPVFTEFYRIQPTFSKTGGIGGSRFFSLHRFFKHWLRQGDPLSPVLFNFVTDILSRIMQKAVDAGLIKGLGSDLVDNGVISLQYADDTILFVEKNETYTQNLKWILTCFELMSGMRINYHKSELVPINISEAEEVQIYANVFGCPVGAFPIKYLGIPLHYTKLRREDIQPLIDKIGKRIAGWRGKLLTQAGRMVLIKTCLASIPVYLLTFIKFPRWAINLINSHMTNCFWDDYEGHKKLHLAN
jgi:hypothetical protein